jgi:hypothetical protein
MTTERSTMLPPRWAESLLRMLLAPEDRDSVSGDLLEEYRESIVPALRGKADGWYVRQVAASRSFARVSSCSVSSSHPKYSRQSTITPRLASERSATTSCSPLLGRRSSSDRVADWACAHASIASSSVAHAPTVVAPDASGNARVIVT